MMMNITEAMDVLTRADPCGQVIPDPPTKRSPTRSMSSMRRAIAVMVASCLLAGGGIVAAQAAITAYQSPEPVTTWTFTSLSQLSASPEDYTDVHRPDISTMLDEMTQVYPLPPNTTAATAFAPLRATFPMSPGVTLPASPADRIANPYFFGIPNSPVDSDHIQQPQEFSVAGLSGTAALLAVNSWYEYWLTATPAQRKAAQPVLDSFQTWADLAFRLGSTQIGETGRISLIARNAEAAANGNPKPIRTWLTQKQWIDPTLL